MTEEFNLKATTRKKEEKPNQVRRDNFIPVILYGPSVKESQELKIKKGEFERVYNQAGESSLINLKNDQDKKEEKILIKDIQRDPVKGDIIHADFYQVKMDEKIYTEIPLSFIGESKAVKELGGYLTKNLDSLEVECLPGDLVYEIEVDISQLESFEDDIKVKDLQIPKGIIITLDPEEVVATTTPPQEEEEEKEESTEEDAKTEKKTPEGGEQAQEKEEASS